MDADRWRRVQSVLDAALTRGPGRWAAVLDETCQGDAELRREVEALLARLDTARGFLESPPATLAAALVAEAREAEEGPRHEGRRIGAYCLVREVGRGGMARVFLAERADGQFDQRVALKLLRPGLDTEFDRERFRTERQILATLNHPNIARLLDGGVTDDGQPYLVLELVEGQPIDVYSDERRLSLRNRLDLFLTVCAATQYAHRNLIVHRDLKPSNILVSADGVVKLLDFGLAKLLASQDSAFMTRTGQRWMTPEYAAPEQIRGEPVTTLTDVYQLGVVLYQLLAGRPPFAGRSGGVHELEEIVLHEDPEPPSSVAARGSASMGKPLRGDLDAIALTALRKAPDRRYASAEALGEDLRRFLDGRPVLARPDTVVYRSRKFVRRHRPGVLLGGAAVLALLLSAIFSIRQMREAERQRDAAVLESRRADAQVAFQEVLLSEVGDRPVTMREILDAGRSVLERQSADDPSLRTSLLLQLADMYGSLHDTETRATLLGRAESLAVAGSAPELLPEVGCQTADNLRLEGRYEEAWRKLDESLDLLRATSPRDPQVEVACLLAHSHLASEAGSTGGRTEEAIPAARRGLAIRDSLGQTVDTTYAGLLSVLADGLQQAGEEREASGILRRAIALMDSVGRGGTIDRSILRHNLALSLVKIGEIDDAEAIFQEVLRIVQQADPSGWIAWQPLVHYAETALTQAHPDSALKYFQIIVTQAVRDTSLYWEGRGSFGTARALVQLGRLAEARRAKDRLEEIIALHPQVKRTDDQVPDGRTLDGWLALAEGDTAAAKSAFMASLRANGYFEGERRRQLRPVVLLVGECTLALGQEREALEWARQALAIAAVDSLAHARSAAVGEARLLEARALLESGDSNGARAAAHRAWSALRVGAGPQHPQTRAAETLVRSLRS